MSTKWRIPTIMELSSFFHSTKFTHYPRIWSCTPSRLNAPGTTKPYYWSGANPSSGLPIYRPIIYSHHLVGIFVKTNGAHLNWSIRYSSCTVKEIREICYNLNSSKIVKIRYTSERPSYA